MTLTTLIVAGVIVLLVILTIVGLLSRYRRCPSDKLLVVFGRNKTKTIEEAYKDVDGKEKIRKVTLHLPAKIIQGGGTFVWPIVQDYREMSLRPILLSKKIEGVSSQMIKTFVSIELSVAIGNEEELRMNAASRFLSANESEIKNSIEAIYVGEVRSLMARMTIEELNSDREAFLTDAKRNIEIELQKVGFVILNINISDLDDDADYITNLGQKAATQAKATAEADIAEQEKIGEVKIANTKKEKSIQLAEAQKEEEIQVAAQNKDRETTVAQTKQEQEVRVAEIEKEKQTKIADTQKAKEVQLAEIKKDKESGIASQKALEIAAIAEADANAESSKAEAEARKVAAVAAQKAKAESSKAESESNQRKAVAAAQADAEATENEKEALKQTRIAQANQKKEADIIQATQEKEAKQAEFESQKQIRKAKAD